MMKIAKGNLPALYAAMAKDAHVYLPIEKADKVDFYLWQKGAKVRLDVLKTVKSAKDVFFPQCENLVAFEREGKNITITPEALCETPIILFGVRGCDVKGFEVLDKVFLSDPVDSFYKARREHCTIVSMACSNPADSCFCKNFGVDAASPAGDVTCWQKDDYLYFNANTKKGEKLLDSISTLLEKADKALVDAEKAEIKAKVDALPYSHLNMSRFTGENLKELFEAPEWAKLSATCIGCGTCTFVCPTCQCYDIRDFDTGHGVQRFRCWDSCMYKDFTMMASGTPRPTQLERFRQRFMHKLVYYPANFDGMYSCVGCGRCVEKCPIHMSILKVITALGGKENGK